MPWPHPAVPSPTLALAGWSPLSPTGAQTTQLLVDPPWRPAVLWDRVTLTCQGLGTTGATTWYKDGQLWWQEGPDNFTVTERGTYMCHRPGTGLSPPVMVSDDDLVLQVPTGVLLEGDTMTLRCRCGHWNHTVTRVRFYQDEKEVRGFINGTELPLFPLQLHHSGHYSCGGLVGSWQSRSAAVAVTVHVPVDNVTITPGVLEVTPQDKWTHRETGAAGIGGALLFLLLLMGVIVAWHRWHSVAARKQQERAPLDPPAPPEEGEVLSPTWWSPRGQGDSQVTYVELRGPQGQPQEPGDI
ncbi:low affinity immunoglobulin gamma Fc region receptor III-like [Zonotrichia leucophrys gambelii]|uniref:low affinity immunoglobulin gamma Fc region receptor III-like n=1 Tax=Zonotrichia leucophrys gambelii TaxID=257770 RepID=UPI003140252B